MDSPDRIARRVEADGSAARIAEPSTDGENRFSSTPGSRTSNRAVGEARGRTDRAVSPLASVKYFASRYLTLGFDYRYLNFDSSGVGVLGYYRNVYLLSAHVRM